MFALCTGVLYGIVVNYVKILRHLTSTNKYAELSALANDEKEKWRDYN